MVDSNIYFIIALIGTGQLGSRYLQGLATCVIPLEIFVFDPNEKSLKTVQTRWKEVDNGNSLHRVHFSKTLEGLPAEVDLCLVTTTADVRLQVVEQVQSQCKVRYWVLEKVLAQSVSQIDRLEQLLTDAEGTWVNLPMRSMKWHGQIRQYLTAPLEAIYGSGMWGLACNAIHYLDLLAWWSGESLVSLDSRELRDWFPSKRNGFWEVNGTLKAHFTGGSRLVLVAGEDATTLLNISLNGKNHWCLDENSGSFVGPNNFCLSGEFELQSQLTGPLVQNILKYGNCSLPTLKEPAKMHRLLIDSLLNHWNASQQLNDTVLPIT